MISRLRTNRGFTLTELLLIVAVIGTLAAMTLPVMQDARLKAVSSNRLLRVRMNCPSTGSIRTVEVIGTAADSAADRCQTSAYPFPAPDTDVMTRPNFDGPVRLLPTGATVGSEILQFGPDGTAMTVAGGVPQTITIPVTLTITRAGKSRSVTINNAGKIQLQ